MKAKDIKKKKVIPMSQVLDMSTKTQTKNQQVFHNQDDKNEEKPETAGEEPKSLAIAGTKI